jgi:hypothetical protein
MRWVGRSLEEVFSEVKQPDVAERPSP